MPGNVIISTANIPEGFCPPWLTTEKWSQLIALLTANLQGTLNTFNFGSTSPAPEDWTKPWLKTTSDGFPDGQYWVKNGEYWYKQHPMVPGSIILYEGSLDPADLDLFDGGELGDATTVSGRMWERVSEMNGRFPLGVGTQVTSGTVIAQGDTGGEETHVLTVGELAAHTHPVLAKREGTGSDGTTVQRLAPALSTPGDSYGDTGETGGDEPHNNMPPWTGIGFIRRTIRQYYKVLA